MKQPESVQKLINAFSRLPGVGQKTAQRYAYAVIAMDKEDALDFASAIEGVKEKIKFCSVCGNFTEDDVCDICKIRDHSVICVVSDPRDILSLERVAGRTFVYHVLGGTLNPLEGKGPDDLNIKSLLDRVDGVQEVIVATNPDVEGETTAVYLARLLQPLGIQVSRIAHGIPVGGDLEYTDDVTLLKSFEGRRKI